MIPFISSRREYRQAIAGDLDEIGRGERPFVQRFDSAKLKPDEIPARAVQLEKAHRAVSVVRSDALVRRPRPGDDLAVEGEERFARPRDVGPNRAQIGLFPRERLPPFVFRRLREAFPRTDRGPIPVEDGKGDRCGQDEILVVRLAVAD